MRNLIAALMLCATSFAQAVPAATTKAMPLPFAEGGVQINTNGVQSVGGITGFGVDEESSRLIAYASGTYGFQRKTNDADQTIGEKGHTRAIDGAAFLKVKQWFLGAGVGWDQSANTPYTKTAWYPRIGGGYDFPLWRLQAMYIRNENEQTRYPALQTFTPGPGQPAESYTCRCTNNVQGIEVNVWYPNPSANKHMFMHVNALPVWFHESETDPYNLALTKSQKSQREYGSTYSVSLLYRF